MAYKISKESATIGERLTKQREAGGMSAQDLAREVQAPLKYIEALEQNHFEIFSAKVYARGYLKKVLEILAFENSENILKEFDAEWEVQMFHRHRDPVSLPKANKTLPFLTPRAVGIGVGAACALFLVGFLGWRLIGFLGAPRLTVIEPMDQETVERPLVRVRGVAEKESRLTVNGRELRMDERGNFNEEIELATGLNALEFFVQDKFGKVTKSIRYVLVK